MKRSWVLVLLLAACEITPRASMDPARAVVYDEHGEPAGLHRHRRWSKKIGQGAQPEGEIACKNLAALGYTTVLNVDGAVPPANLAATYGLDYVHVPIGYDGITEDEAARIVSAVTRSKGPVYVHCHHGRHRGPAAAMLGRIVTDGITNEEAVEGLKISGTSPRYEGLWRDVAKFKGCSDAALARVPAKLPSKVLPQGVRATMVDVNLRYEFLQESRAEGWKVPADSPDISPPHEARMLWELYREMQRIDESKKLGAEFLRLTAAGEKAAVALEKALRAGDNAAADKAYKQIKQNCNACHADYRN